MTMWLIKPILGALVATAALTTGALKLGAKAISLAAKAGVKASKLAIKGGKKLNKSVKNTIRESRKKSKERGVTTSRQSDKLQQLAQTSRTTQQQTKQMPTESHIFTKKEK